MKKVEKQGFDSCPALMHFHHTPTLDVGGFSSAGSVAFNGRKIRQKDDERQVTVTMCQAEVEPKRRNFWKGEQICLHKPNADKIYTVHETEYLDEYDNWILNLYDPMTHRVLHIQTFHTNLYLVHDPDKASTANAYNFEISAYYFIANRTGLNLEYNFVHKGKSHLKSGLPEQVDGTDLHCRMNNYTKLMVPKVLAYIKTPPSSQMCHFDPPIKAGERRSKKDTKIQTLVCPKIDVEEMEKDPKYSRIPTLLLKTRSRQLDPSNHLLLFNPHTGWSQKVKEELGGDIEFFRFHICSPLFTFVHIC